MTLAFSLFPTFTTLLLLVQSLAICIRVSISLFRAKVWREGLLAGLGFLMLASTSGLDLWSHPVARIFGRELFLGSGFFFLLIVFQGVSGASTDSVNMRRLLIKILIFGLLFSYFVSAPGREHFFVFSCLFVWALIGVLLLSKRKEVGLPLRSYCVATLFLGIANLQLFWSVPWPIIALSWVLAQYFFFLMLNYFLCRSVVRSRLE